MPSSRFVDSIRLFLRAGHGGAGALHFRRTRFNPKGGPDGGNGGKGGDIILVGSPHIHTLLDLRYRKHILAQKGTPGKPNDAHGAHAKDVRIPVPLGTIVKNFTTGKVIAEVTRPNEEKCIAKGGRGGLGNAHFKNAQRQAPQFAQPGEPGEEKEILMELKLMADVGLVGEPNAGKSTLLSVLSAARPQIGDYPFTTLRPQLGLVRHYENSFVMADIPGLIKGAAQGKGLGLQFLRHIERTQILLFTIPADHPDILGTYHMLTQELLAHGIPLAEKIHCLALTKSDLLTAQAEQQLHEKISPHLPFLLISAQQKKGLQPLITKLWTLLQKRNLLPL